MYKKISIYQGWTCILMVQVQPWMARDTFMYAGKETDCAEVPKHLPLHIILLWPVMLPLFF